MTTSLMRRLPSVRLEYSMSVLLADDLLSDIVRLGEAALPYEACGVICQGVVISVPNRAPDPTRSYLIQANEITEAVTAACGPLTHDMVDDLIIWHTHPSGLVGPSREDMTHRLENYRYLVVAMPSGIPTWF